MRFQDQVVLITGGAGGIGIAVASRFAKEGANIVLVDINPERLEAASAQIKQAASTEILTSICNVSMEDQVAATVQAAISRFGRLDVIVNNAGLMLFEPIEKQTGEEWQRTLGVDLMGAVFFTKEAFLNMKPGGRIVNVASVHAIQTTPMVAPYAAAKAALSSLTRSSAIEGKPKGIRVNAVLPGAIDTPMLWENPNVKAGIEKNDAADVGKPEDIAGAIAFLASDDAAFIHGVSLLVDGGRLTHL